MSIFHALTVDGAFVCGDTKSGFTSYAYPTSPHAVAARRKPKETAAEMIANETAFTGRNKAPSVEDYDRRNWQTLRDANVLPMEAA